MAGSFGKHKTVNKSEVFASHGTHSVDPGVLQKAAREKLQKLQPKMFPSVRAAFNAARKR